MLRLVLMGGQQTKQAGTLRQMREEVRKVCFEPAIEGPVANTFESEQHSQGDNLAGIQKRLSVFFLFGQSILQGVIDAAEEF